MSQDMIAQLSETRNHLIKEIIVLSSPSFNNRWEPNEWSIAQVCHHLFLVERATARAIEIGLKTSSYKKAAQKDFQFVLDRTRKRIAPEIVEPGDGPFEVQQILKWLHDSRDYLITLLNSIEDKSILDEKSFQHPVYGNLSLNQWVELLYLHEQRHIGQIIDMKRAIGIRN